MREIDTLWFDNSAGRFGFRVQKDIYRATGNIPDPEKFNEASYIRFAHEVGWNRINGNIEEIAKVNDDRIYWLSYYYDLSWSEGMDGGELKASETPLGHLPIWEGLGGGFTSFHLLASRTVACNI